MNKNTSNKHLNELFELLSIPTISAQSKHDKDIETASQWLNKKLNNLGFKSQVLSTGGHPVVYAENLVVGKQKPTVLIYGHYDVQSPDPISNWTSDPFRPEIRSGNIYARGAADDKGQLYTWIAAVEEILQGKKGLPVNIKFLLEGEEEVGSVNLDNFINQNKTLLECDVCVISDSHCLTEEQPMITYGVRGLVYTEITVKTLEKDVHSGIYGGNVLNPANILANIISQLKDKDGKVLVPKFYANVRKLSKKESGELLKMPFGEKEVFEETGAKVISGEQGYSIQERAGARPTLDVNGIWGGYTEEGPKTIIPSTASAKISMRLVPNQSSQEIFEKFENYIKSIVPEGVEIEIKSLSTGEPAVMNKGSKFFKQASRAYEKVFGKKPVFELSGGSIPITATLKSLLGIDSVMMGYGLPDDGLHSPNEKLSLTMFKKGIQTNIEFLTSL